MKDALDNEETPLDANLEAVIPGLHQWQSQNNADLQGVGQKVDRVEGKMDSMHTVVTEGFKSMGRVLHESIRNSSQDTTTRIARSFLNVGSQLLGRPCVPTDIQMEEDVMMDSYLEDEDKEPPGFSVRMSQPTSPSPTATATATVVTPFEIQTRADKLQNCS